MAIRWRYAAVGMLAMLLLCAVIYRVLSGLSLALPAMENNPAKAIPTAPRPEITVDESKNPRWVKSLAESSLADSEVDRVHLQNRPDGTLILVPGILVYFDYFLSLRGEMAMQRIKQIVWDDIHANFPPRTAARLYDLFERYIAYSEAVDKRLSGLTYSDVQAQHLTGPQIEQSLQPDFFSSEEIDSLFKGYNDMLDYTPRSTQFREKYRKYKDTPPEYRFAMATELFGAEAAGRMQALQQRRHRWQQRLEDYDRQKQQILTSNDLDDHGKQAAIKALLQRSFDEHEQVRVSVWEKYLRDKQGNSD